MGNKDMSEELSALIDNELDEHGRVRVLRELGSNEELAERWSRYHIIGLALRREQISPAGELPTRVARALEAESGTGYETTDSGHRQPPIRAAGRFAIAASVAGVLLVGGLIVTIYDGSRPTDTAPIAAPQVAVNDNGMHWEGAGPGSEDALNALLIEHGEFTSVSGMNGLTAYSKFVAYDSQ